VLTLYAESKPVVNKDITIAGKADPRGSALFKLYAVPVNRYKNEIIFQL
jgi:hypothetical protein